MRGALVIVLAVASVAGLGGSPRVAGSSVTPPRTQIEFVLGLRLEEHALQRYVDRMGEPLSAAEVGARFGPPLRGVRAVTRDLESHGISVARTFPQRTDIVASASAAVLERYFGVPFRRYTTPDGRPYDAPAHQPVVPRRLARWVSGVIGLDTRPLNVPHEFWNLRPVDAAAAYGLAPLHRSGLTGRGATIAVLSFQEFSKSDLDLFEHGSTFDVKGLGPPPRVVRIGSGAVSERGTEEANLDVQVIRGTAPGATIVVYEAPNNAAGELALLDRFAAGSTAIGSYSWGLCDVPDNFRTARDYRAYRSAINKALAVAAARGKTLFVSSGDSGAYTCQRQDFSDHRRTVSLPADSPYVVAVGGTVLATSRQGAYLGESAWVDTLAYAGTGGGISPLDAKPPWQRGVVPGPRRGVPDVAASASPTSGWIVYQDGRRIAAGGTSASAPFWAASMLIAQQYATTRGVRTRCFLAPLLYRLAGTPAFHDVTVGGNRYYAAQRGWDYATGLGSPDVARLAAELVRYLGSHPGDCTR
jgi:kumamolisin